MVVPLSVKATVPSPGFGFTCAVYVTARRAKAGLGDADKFVAVGLTTL
jgi:hypothetical protein